MILFSFCKNETTTNIDRKQEINDLLSYVDPFIGTGEHGHVYPGATVPFGMVQLSPDNGTQGWDWCSGYNWDDSLIVGFSHTHLSGTGIGDLLDISVMPTNKKVDFSEKIPPRENVYAAAFDHKNETASPGYYSVKLDNGIAAELTATTRTGVHRYTFPNKENNSLLIDLGFAINWDKPLETAFNIIDNKTITGHRISTGWAEDQRVYFAFHFDQPFSDDISIADSTLLKTIEKNKPVTAERLRMQLSFPAQKEITFNVGLSTTSTAGAVSALTESQQENFNTIRNKAAEAWVQELSKVEVQSDREAEKRTFYTALYRTSLAPVIMSDADGSYKGVDGKIQKMEKGNRYCIFSLWDTFRAANPLTTITQPDRVNDFIRSMLNHYDEYGLLPVWSLLGNETNTMTGYHAIPVILDAYQKGFRDYDVEKAYAAMVKSSMQDIRASDHYRKYGYIPYDKSGQSVTRTLEYAYDDWCIAQMAKALNKEEEYQKYIKRAASYRPLFDASTGFMRAKLADGSWKKPFDPQYSSHDFDVAEYTEGNAWQHSWFVPHAIEDLIQLHGGNEKFVQKLDALFTVSSEIKGDFISADISGLIGQYAHGNEPSHHIAYLYNYAGKDHKTQEQVRNIMKTQYNDTPYGLCGNEDCGQMSAWYVFSAMGLYPVNPASGRYDFGSPIFDEVKINLENNKTFTIIANNNSATNLYIASAKLNGEPYDKNYVMHEDIINGGTLEFEMTNAK